MSGFLPISEIITSEIFKSALGAITGLSGALTAIYGLYKFIKKLLNAPIKGKSEFLNSAGIPTWPHRLFAINISLKTIPKNSKSDIIMTFGFITLIIGCVCYLSYMHIKTFRTPENWTLLVYNPTGESFYINHDVAKGTSLLPSRVWVISKKSCNITKKENSPSQNGLTKEMEESICQIFNDENFSTFVEKSIENFKHEKSVIYFILTIFYILFSWMGLSLILTMHYKKVIQKYIITQNEKTMFYIT